MRRLTSFLTSLLLLHLTLVAADLTCATHGVQGAKAATHAATSSHADREGHASHHAPVEPDRSHHADDLSCDIPTLPACCQALASCGLSVAGNSSATSGDLSHLAAGVLGGADDAPVSWILEPDTPPPKA